MGLILVTGAMGFAGKYVCEELLAEGHEIIGTSSRANIGTHNSDIPLRVIDIRDLDATRSLIKDLRPTHVVHLAGVSSPAGDDKLGFFDVNTLGTLNLLDACRIDGSHIEKVILASSANVYGEPGAEVLHEGICPKPVNVYGCSKLAMEHLSEKFRESFALQIVRPFNFTGRGQTMKFLVPKIVHHFKIKKSEIELGNINVSRDFSDVRDVAMEFVKLLKNTGATQTVNICSGNFLKLDEIISICRDITGHDVRVSVNPNFVRENEILRLKGSRDRLDSLVGKRPTRPFTDTLHWMLGN